jgi:tetratricopeptide (TPR) repeat protein
MLGALARLRPPDPAQAKLEAAARSAWSEALREFQRVRDKDPRQAALAGECLLLLGHVREAAEVFTWVVQQQPDHLEAHRRLASIYYDLGVMILAIKHLEEVARLDPDDGRPYLVMGLINKDYQRTGLAMDAYRAALQRRLAPEAKADAVKNLAELLIENGSKADYKEALDLLSRCPPPHDQKPIFLCLRAECLWKIPGRDPEATALVDAALRREPDLVRALLLRAEMDLDVEQPQGAVPLLERAARLEPYAPKIHERLARAYRLQGDRLAPWAAVQQANQVLLHVASGLGPGQATGSAIPNLYEFVRRQFFYRPAEEHLKLHDVAEGYRNRLTQLHSEAMEKTWDDGVRYQIALLWLKMDQPSMARSWLQAALVCNPQNVEARIALSRLEAAHAR